MAVERSNRAPMPGLMDVPTAVRKMGFIPLIKRIWEEIEEDNLFTWASALAYSWLFAIFPFFIFLLTFLPYLPDSYRRHSDKLIEQFIGSLPEQSQDTVRQLVSPHLDKLFHDVPSGVRVVGLLVTIWAASGGIAATMSALDRAYDVKKYRSYFVHRAVAIVLTLVAALMAIALVVLVPIGTIVTRFLYNNTETAAGFFERHLGSFSPIATFVRNHANVVFYIWQVVRFSLAFVLLFGVVSIIYHYGPNLRQRYRIFTPGAVFTISVWMILGSLFRYYVDHFGKYNQTYGTVGGVAILLLFFYIDAAVLLIGAEINSEIDYDTLNVPRGTYDLRKADRARLQKPPKD